MLASSGRRDSAFSRAARRCCLSARAAILQKLEEPWCSHPPSADQVRLSGSSRPSAAVRSRWRHWLQGMNPFLLTPPYLGLAVAKVVALLG